MASETTINPNLETILREHRVFPPSGIHLAWITLLVGTVINAFYEEIIYMGYGFNLWAAKYGPRTAVLFSILARLSVHTYQGTEHLLPIGMWAVIFAQYADDFGNRPARHVEVCDDDRGSLASRGKQG